MIEYLTTLCYIFFVVSAIVLIVIILLQEGKGGGFGQFLGEGGQQVELAGGERHEGVIRRGELAPPGIEAPALEQQHPVFALGLVVAAGALTPDEGSFSFIGFLPPKTAARRVRWRKFSNAPGSVVAFVPPHKLVATLQDAAAELGERRQCVVCREMTKVRARRLSRRFFFSVIVLSRRRAFSFSRL